MIKNSKYYIFGAHSRAQTLAVYLRTINPENTLCAYLVDNDEANMQLMEDTEVLRLESTPELDTDVPVYIGTRGVYHEAVTAKLKELGFTDIRPVTVALDMELRNEFLKRYYAEQNRTYRKLEMLSANNASCQEIPDMCKSDKATSALYVVKSIYDQVLSQDLVLSEAEKLIQVGTALTDIRLTEAAVFDNAGENISAKNKQFCELTALYWIWKNATEDIIGLEHYRRYFILPEDWQQRMRSNDVDVILPVPLYVAPSVEANYKFRHDPSDWEYMLEYLQEKLPEDYTKAAEFFSSTSLYCPCNMFIMRREVLDEFCSWLFPILFAVEEHGGIKENAYFNRYPGFISERLMTYYFETRRGKYNLVYCDKNFLS